jgi:hypothetical protein
MIQFIASQSFSIMIYRSRVIPPFHEPVRLFKELIGRFAVDIGICGPTNGERDEDTNQGPGEHADKP